MKQYFKSSFIIVLLILLVHIIGETSNMGFSRTEEMHFTPNTANLFWISLPFFVSYTTAEDVCVAIQVTSVRKYNPPVNGYTIHSCGGSNNFTVVKGESYGVTITHDVSARLAGAHDDLALLSYSFTNGVPNLFWISIPWHSTASTAEDICQENTSFSSISLYQSSSDSYLTHTCGDAIDDFSIRPGIGFAINIKSTTNWTPAHY